MGAKWKDFQMPKSIICDENTLSDTYGKFVAEPFERGFAHTIGRHFSLIDLNYYLPSVYLKLQKCFRNS